MAIIRKSITGLKPGSDYLFTLKPKNVEISAADSEQETIRVSIPVFDGTPSIITGLQLASNFQTVIFKFDPINDADLSYFEYQLYDNEFGTGTPINPVTSTSNDPILISGTNVANVFLVSVENSTDTQTTQYWGRVRAVNIAGNPSTEWSDLIASGELDLISDGFIGSLTAAKITSGTIGAHTIELAGATSIIQSSNYSSGVSGWKITGFGDAEFNDLTVRTSLDIGGNDSTSFHVDIDGNMWLGSGVLNFSTAPFRVNNNGNFYVGNSTSTKYVSWNGTDLTIRGNITADSGTFNGTVNASGGTFTSYITAGVTQIGKNVRNAADHNGIALDSGSWNNAWVRRGDGSVYFRAGTDTKYIQMDTISGGTSAINFPNFSVNNDGNITATGATISGTINASSGTFSGTITATGTISGGTLTGALITGSQFQLGSNQESGYVRMNVDSYTYFNGVKFYNRDYAGWAGAFYPYADNSYDLGIDNRAGTTDTRYAWQDIRYWGNLIDFSDSRMKLDIKDSNLGIDFIKKLKPVSYRKKTRRSVALENENGEILRNEDGAIIYEHEEGIRTHYGLIAQDVKKAIEDIGIDPNAFAAWKLSDIDDPDSTQSLAYIEFISPIIKSIQELSDKLDAIEARLV